MLSHTNGVAPPFDIWTAQTRDPLIRPDKKLAIETSTFESLSNW